MWFGKKRVQTEAEAKQSKKAVDQEQELLEFAQSANDSRRRATAIVLHLSKASGFGYENYLYAINMFKGLVARMHQGRLFVLGNKDLCFTYAGVPGDPLVKDATLKIRLLFDVNSAEDDNSSGENAFASWFNLESHPEPLLDYARFALAEKAKASVAKKAAHQEAQAQQGGKPLSPDALTKFMNLFATADLAPMVRRQPVCFIQPDGLVEPLYWEVYVSIADLEKKLMPTARLTADRYLFQFVTQALDKRVLRLMKQEMEMAPTSHFSINVNVTTFLSPEFDAFDAVLSEEVRQTLVLELPRMDVLADIGMYIVARDRVHDRGYRICMDGLSAVVMPFIRLQDLGFDYFKINWQRDLASEQENEQRSLLKGVIERCGAEKMILCHCDTEEAIRFGHSMGIGLFQGRFVDSLINGEAQITPELDPAAEAAAAEAAAEAAGAEAHAEQDPTEQA